MSLWSHPDGEGDERGEEDGQRRDAAQVQHEAHAAQCRQVGAHPAEHDLTYRGAELCKTGDMQMTWGECWGEAVEVRLTMMGHGLTLDGATCIMNDFSSFHFN